VLFLWLTLRYYRGKCYRLIENKLSFADAQRYCQESVSSDSRLVEITDYNELSVVQRICRGDSVPVSTSNIGVSKSPARASGCWIGLQMSSQSGQFEWLAQAFAKQTVQNTVFRDWRWNEPNNHTFSEGQSTSGELCTILVPWQEDPLIKEHGSWNDVACKLLKPAVCQANFPTHRFSLNVSGSAVILNGNFEGGYLNLRSDSLLGSLSLFRSAFLSLSAPTTASMVVVGDIHLLDGSHLIMNASVYVHQGLQIGEPHATAANGGILPVVTVSSHATLTFSSTCTSFTPSRLHGYTTLVPACAAMYNASVNAGVTLLGRVLVDKHVNVFFSQVSTMMQCFTEFHALCYLGRRLIQRFNPYWCCIFQADCPR
jgi:hypothetical protein